MTRWRRETMQITCGSYNSKSCSLTQRYNLSLLITSKLDVVNKQTQMIWTLLGHCSATASCHETRPASGSGKVASISQTITAPTEPSWTIGVWNLSRRQRSSPETSWSSGPRLATSCLWRWWSISGILLVGVLTRGRRKVIRQVQRQRAPPPRSSSTRMTRWWDHLPGAFLGLLKYATEPRYWRIFVFLPLRKCGRLITVWQPGRVWGTW